MSDPVMTARTARESLAKGLNALQSDPNIPPNLLELAAPIAQSMGALHQIERSNGVELQPHAELALNNVRNALAQLQAQPPSHPAVAQALEAVAASLGLLHALGRHAGQAQHAPPQAAVHAAPAYSPTVAAAPAAQPYVPPPAAAPAYVAPNPGRPVDAHAPTAIAAAPAPHAAPAAGPQGGFPQRSQDPFQPAATAPKAPAAASAPMPAGDVNVIPADLGAHSPTNFYKGLSGNDIIDHGGLFVSTYRIPKIGTPVRLRISLPGGYEFEANAVVRWSREPRDASGDAPPGFGAQFTQITAEARQLVYRYVRNREPLFHDDL